MGQYDDVLWFLSRCESQEPGYQKMNARRRFTAEEVGRLRDDYPGIPEDCLDYLAEVGAGAFRECQYGVYNGFIAPDHFFGDRAEAFGKRLLCFGDNLAGDVGAFVPDEGWAVVELLHEDLSIAPAEQSFAWFIRGRMLMGPNGEDLRGDSADVTPPPPSAGPAGQGPTTDARPRPWWKWW